MQRKWTRYDIEVAKDLGFELVGFTGEHPFLSYTDEFKHYERPTVVDYYVLLLAQEGEPTAVKALDIIQGRDMREFMVIVKNTMFIMGALNGT